MHNFLLALMCDSLHKNLKLILIFEITKLNYSHLKSRIHAFTKSLKKNDV